MFKADIHTCDRSSIKFCITAPTINFIPLGELLGGLTNVLLLFYNFIIIIVILSFHYCDYTLNCGFISYFNFTITFFFSSEAVTGRQLATCENFQYGYESFRHSYFCCA